MSAFLAEEGDQYEHRFSTEEPQQEVFDEEGAVEWLGGCEARYLAHEAEAYRTAYDMVASFIAAHHEDDFSL